jgi:hypothetical protein
LPYLLDLVSKARARPASGSSDVVQILHIANSILARDRWLSFDMEELESEEVLELRGDSGTIGYLAQEDFLDLKVHNHQPPQPRPHSHSGGGDVHYHYLDTDDTLDSRVASSDSATLMGKPHLVPLKLMCSKGDYLRMEMVYDEGAPPHCPNHPDEVLVVQ